MFLPVLIIPGPNNSTPSSFIAPTWQWRNRFIGRGCGTMGSYSKPCHIHSGHHRRVGPYICVPMVTITITLTMTTARSSRWLWSGFSRIWTKSKAHGSQQVVNYQWFSAKVLHCRLFKHPRTPHLVAAAIFSSPLSSNSTKPCWEDLQPPVDPQACAGFGLRMAVWNSILPLIQLDSILVCT